MTHAGDTEAPLCAHIGATPSSRQHRVCDVQQLWHQLHPPYIFHLCRVALQKPMMLHEVFQDASKSSKSLTSKTLRWPTHEVHDCMMDRSYGIGSHA